MKEDAINASDFEQLIALYREVLELRDKTDVEAYTGDDALADGHLLKAEQHYRYSHQYRQVCEKKVEEAARFLKERGPFKQPTSQALSLQARAKARQRLYGCADIMQQPFVD